MAKGTASKGGEPSAGRGSHCILGGTFTYVHEGHLLLLSECRKFRKITIGLTSDAFVKRHKIYPSFPYSRRLASLRGALKRLGLSPRASILRIDDEAGGADRNEEADTLVVSEETEGAAMRINAKRKKFGIAPLKIIVAPLVYGEDLKKISCVSIYHGRTDLKGRLRTPLKIQVATGNPTKRKGTARALRRIFGRKTALLHHSEYSHVSAHPFNSETFTGARNRAIAAWERANGKGAGKNAGHKKSGGCDYSIGIESGLFSVMHTSMHIDITITCVYDGKKETYGTGMGFVVPEHIVRRIIAKHSDLSVALKEITGIERIGWKQGALGWFSKGKMHRSEQIEASVCCAFVPRIAEARLGMKY